MQPITVEKPYRGKFNHRIAVVLWIFIWGIKGNFWNIGMNASGILESAFRIFCIRKKKSCMKN